jgi:hypothetical protein
MSKRNIDRITLTLERANMLGNLPEVISLEQFARYVENKKVEGSNLGLFEVGSPNFATYYPDVTPEDLTPKDDDYVYPLFRALSEVVVRRSSSPIDFSKKGVLRKSLSLLDGQTVYPNHEVFVGNELGVVLSSEWQNSYETEHGTVPAGIIVKLKIDGKASPKIVRSIQSNPPSIHSVSVGVVFAWEQSHKEMSTNEFYTHLGSFDSKGELIRRVVTEVLKYEEISLVPHGADPYAQKVDAAKKIVNPEYAKKSASLSDEKGKPVNFIYSYSSAGDLYQDYLKLSDKDDTIISNNEDILKSNSKRMKLTLTEKLQALVQNKTITLPEGVAELNDDSLVEVANLALEALGSQLTGMGTSLAEATTLSENRAAEITELRKKVEAAGTAELTDLQKASIATAEAVLASTREEAVKNYRLAKGEAAMDSLIEQINTGSYQFVKEMAAAFKADAEALFPTKCLDCNSTNVSKLSSRKDDSPIIPVKLSHDEVMAALEARKIANSNL